MYLGKNITNKCVLRQFYEVLNAVSDDVFKENV